MPGARLYARVTSFDWEPWPMSVDDCRPAASSANDGSGSLSNVAGVRPGTSGPAASTAVIAHESPLAASAKNGQAPADVYLTGPRYTA